MKSKGTLLLVLVTLLSVAAAVLIPAHPQPLSYHQFADQRTLFGIANALDVLSNIGFLVAGAIGVVVTLRRATCFEHTMERWPYVVFFIGMLWTALGSGYYHLAPDNERLFWDRLPMTVAFMSLISTQIGERVNVLAGRMLLVPMLAIGAASVVHWSATEAAGAGNVVPYAVLQGYAVVILLLLAWLKPSRYTRGNDLFLVFAAYVVAKVFELLDQPIFALGHVVSGHALKHLAAAVAGLVLCRMLWLRGLERSMAAPSRSQ